MNTKTTYPTVPHNSSAGVRLLRGSVLIFALAGLLSACNIDDLYNDDSNWAPVIRTLSIIDTLGYANTYPDEHMLMSPYYRSGLFQVSWNVDSSNYYAELLVSRDREGYRSIPLLAVDSWSPSVGATCRYRDNGTVGCWLDGQYEWDAYFYSLGDLGITVPYTLTAYIVLTVWNDDFTGYNYVYQTVDFL